MTPIQALEKILEVVEKASSINPVLQGHIVLEKIKDIATEGLIEESIPWDKAPSEECF